MPVPRRRRRKTLAGDPVLTLPPNAFEDIDPVFETLPVGTRLLRVYSPEPYGTKALTFREHGPHSRFDHQQRDAKGRPRVDSGRGILYAGRDLVCSLGEFFADSTGVIDVEGRRVAALDVVRDVTLVDLRGTAALGVGTTQAIAGISQRQITQAWARHLYGHPDLAHAGGLIYAASNTGRDAMAMFERADGKLAVAADFALSDPAIDADLQIAAKELRMAIV